jgi:hypothetical protein
MKAPVKVRGKVKRRQVNTPAGQGMWRGTFIDTATSASLIVGNLGITSLPLSTTAYAK